jgi:DNA-binding NtrC family response regulator
MAGKKVLIVDLDEINAGCKAELLREDYGFDATASSVEDVCNNPISMHYDGILLTMRDCSARERYALEQAREKQPSAKIVVYSTDFGFMTADKEMKKTGAVPLPMIAEIGAIAKILS